MPALMDLIAGERREILLAISLDDWDAFADTSRFAGHVSLGGLELGWLDQFSAAIRDVHDSPEPADFFTACVPLGGSGSAGERTVEVVLPRWLEAVGAVGDDELDAVAGRWVDLLAEDGIEVLGDDRAIFRQLTADIVRLARLSPDVQDVLFAWSL